MLSPDVIRVSMKLFTKSTIAGLVNDDTTDPHDTIFMSESMLLLSAIMSVLEQRVGPSRNATVELSIANSTTMTIKSEAIYVGIFLATYTRVVKMKTVTTCRRTIARLLTLKVAAGSSVMTSVTTIIVVTPTVCITVGLRGPNWRTRIISGLLFSIVCSCSYC